MISFSFKTRRINRAQWNMIWRQLRIINRETRLAWQDMMLFGRGFIKVGADVPDLIRAVHPKDVWITPDGTAELRS